MNKLIILFILCLTACGDRSPAGSKIPTGSGSGGGGTNQPGNPFPNGHAYTVRVCGDVGSTFGFGMIVNFGTPDERQIFPGVLTLATACQDYQDQAYGKIWANLAHQTGQTPLTAQIYEDGILVAQATGNGIGTSTVVTYGI